MLSETEADRAGPLLAQSGINARIHPLSAPPSFDLLSTVEYGGCSAKLPAELLMQAIRRLPGSTDAKLLVGIDTCDDAGVYQLSDDIALIETTDFFPPVCSDAYEFGQIAAANALSDVYAMGGKVLTVMNLVMFPASGIPFDVLGEILRGGQEKVTEAGGIIVGGHSIADYPPKFGLAVTGIVHPSRVITNANARPGEILVLTKPVGTGAIVAGHRLSEVNAASYQAALDSMKLLNRKGAEVMQKHGIRCATDITGFGLLGHAKHIAMASKITLEIEARRLPILSGAASLIDLGCIPGGAFRNQEYVEPFCRFAPDLSYIDKMLMLDPQTSGGLLMSVPPGKVDDVLADLLTNDYPHAGVVGKTLSPQDKPLVVIK
ncbi:MAG: selenide, water dikinase SelD [Candidatus Riflebacteria bacterium]|nr:selenide, water dikinase SelD [Candidatus Riflebacteria bacterium]